MEYLLNLSFDLQRFATVVDLGTLVGADKYLDANGAEQNLTAGTYDIVRNNTDGSLTLATTDSNQTGFTKIGTLTAAGASVAAGDTGSITSTDTSLVFYSGSLTGALTSAATVVRALNAAGTITYTATSAAAAAGVITAAAADDVTVTAGTAVTSADIKAILSAETAAIKYTGTVSGGKVVTTPSTTAQAVKVTVTNAGTTNPVTIDGTGKVTCGDNSVTFITSTTIPSIT